MLWKITHLSNSVKSKVDFHLVEERYKVIKASRILRELKPETMIEYSVFQE